MLLTTFSDTLAHALKTRLDRLIFKEPRLAERIEVASLEAVGVRLHSALIGTATVAEPEVIVELLREAAGAVSGHKFNLRFLTAEWNEIVDAWQLESWEAYRDVPRLGRKTRLSEAQRQVLWSIFEHVRAGLKERKLLTQSRLLSALARALAKSKKPPYDFAVIDESQDAAICHLRFLAALAASRANGLFFAGDLGQRIFQQPFSWKAVGVDVRGRSRTLRVNYRTSHQIRTQADRLLGPEIADVDGNTESRKDTVSVFNGPPPDIKVLKSEKDETTHMPNWLAKHTRAGLQPHECAIFVRSEAQLERAVAAAKAAKLPYTILDQHVETALGHLSIGTMHLAKGLEFRAVAVMACDDEVIPSQQRMQAVGDDADLQEVYNTERHLLYVACTRARDLLLVTAVAPGSEFLDDVR